MTHTFTWTEPYYGVQHIDGLPKALGAQIDVQDYGHYAVVTLLRPRQSFTPVREHICGTCDAARQLGEQWARLEMGT